MNTFEFLKLNASKTKVHLAVHNGTDAPDADPLKVYFNGSFKEWNNME